MSQTADIEPLLTVKDVAKILQLQKTCLYRMCDTGRIPHVRVPGCGSRGSIRFVPQVVRDWIEGGARGPLALVKPPKDEK